MTRPRLALVRLAATSFVASCVLLGGALQARADDAVPYDDPAATGTITLCDEDLQPVTSGSVDHRPFVWRAVGSVRAPAPYDDANRRAVLYAYQPRKGVPPGLWTGELLTAASTYTNVEHPMAQATILDWPLRYFVRAFPPEWKGLLQLRLYYTTNLQPPSVDYAALDIKVEGDTWRVAGRPGSSDCQAGDAVSPELELDNYSASAKALEKQQARREATASPSPGASQEPSPSATVRAGESPSAIASGVDATNGSGTSGGGVSPAVWGLVLGAAAVGAGVVVWRRRRW